jgi:hypothetical protein
MQGLNQAVFAPSSQARLGGLSCEASFWTSDTVLECRFASDPGGLWKPIDNGAVVTIATRPGSLTKMITYNAPHVSSMKGTNAATHLAGSFSLTIFGFRFGSGLSMLTGLELGSADFTPKARVGLTAGATTKWISDSSLYQVCTSGVSSLLAVVASLGVKKYTTYPYFTFDSASVSGISKCNAAYLTGSYLTITGLSFGIADYSGRAALGTALEAMMWTSDTSVSGVPAPGMVADVAVKMSVGAHSLDGIGFEGCLPCYQYNALTSAWSYDSVVIDYVTPPNGGSSGGIALSILGQHFSNSDYSSQARLGGTGCEFSRWTSCTAVVCSTPPGDNSAVRSATLTIYARFATYSEAFTFDNIRISAVHPRNGPKTGNVIGYIIGQNIKVTDSSPQARIQETACRSSAWVSDSIITCRLSASTCVGHDVIATVGRFEQTVQSVFSSDSNSISAVYFSNKASDVAVVSISGKNIATWAASAGVRTGGTSAQKTLWTSDSSMAAGVSHGAWLAHGISVTVCNNGTYSDSVGTLSLAFSYNAPVVIGAAVVDATSLVTSNVRNLPGISTTDFMLAGVSFSSISFTAALRISSTSAEQTTWYSDSSMIGRSSASAYSNSADGSFAVTIGKVGTLSRIYSYDTAVLISVSEFTECTSCNSITLSGREFKIVDASVKARLGGLPCQASFWISDSSIVSHIGGNPMGLSIRSDSGAVITVQGRLGSLTNFITYAEPNVTSITRSNIPATGKTSMTVSGSRFGSGLSFVYGLEVGIVDSTLSLRAGRTACEATTWRSDSSLSVKISAGYADEQNIIVSVGLQKQTLIALLTYDAATVSSIVELTGCTSCNSLTLFGNSFAKVDPTLKVRLGGVPCEASHWSSCSSVACRIAAISLGLSSPSDSGIVVTVERREGSFTKSLEYSLHSITAVRDSNSPTGGKTSVTILGTKFGSGLSFLLGVEVGIADWSLESRISGTACESTTWVSDTAVTIQLGHGLAGDRAMTLTLVTLCATSLEDLSYNTPIISSGSSSESNLRPAGTYSRFFGIFENFRNSLTTTFGQTAADQTYWLSSSTINAHAPSGLQSSMQLVITSSRAVGTLTDAVSYNTVVLYELASASNVAARPASWMTIEAHDLLNLDISGQLRVHSTAMESSKWISDTCVIGLHPAGISVSYGLKVTAGAMCGSITQAVSFDSTRAMYLMPVSNTAITPVHIVTFQWSGTVYTDVSQRGRLGQTACENTAWLSDSSLLCRPSCGLQSSHKTLVTAGLLQTTRTEVFSIDVGVLIVAMPSNYASIGATFMTVQGSNMGLSTYTGRIRDGQTACEASEWISETSMRCRAATGYGSGFVVLTAGQKASSICSACTFDVPIISSITPTNMMTVYSVSMTLAGLNFVNSDKTSTVRTGGTPCEASTWKSSSSILCKVATGISTLLGITASVKSGSGTLSNSFSYSGPTVSTTSIVNAPTRGGAQITLRGDNSGAFDYSQNIRVEGTACSASKWQAQSAIVCLVPSGSGLSLDTVLTVGSQFGTLSSQFTFNLPSINSIFPMNFPTTGRTTISLIGGEFGTSALGQEARVGGTTCLTTQYVSDSSLYCGVPAGLGRNPSIQVLSSGLSGFGRNLVSYDAPTVSAMTPSNDATSGGKTISVFGSGFGTTDFALSNHTILMDISGYRANLSGYHSDSTIIIRAPAGVGKSLQPTVTVASQVGLLSGAFSYDLPVVSDFYPRNSPTKGGITVTVQGFNLGDGQYNLQTARILSGNPLVNKYAGTVIGTPSFTILLMILSVGAGANKLLDVTVAGQSGHSLTPVVFNFDDPNITLVYPRFGGTLGGDTLSIIGNNFGPGLPPVGGPVAISYHDANGFPGECASISTGPDPHTQLFCLTKRGAGRALNLTVNVDAQIATFLGAFSYAAPVVNSIIPNYSPASGGGTVTVFGSNFGIIDYDTNAQIGNTLCTSVQWSADSQMRCTTAAGAGGAHSVSAGSNGQFGSRANLFSFSAPILAISTPMSGPTSGGFDVTITGSNFGTDSIYSTSARVGGRECNQTNFISDTSMLIRIPPGGGTQVVQVVVSAQTSNLLVPFYYYPPVITSITPRNGLSVGGNLLQVYGSFGQVNTSPYVTFGLVTGTPCTSNMWTSDTAMTTVSPAGKGFPHNVFVVIPGFQISMGSMHQAWCYDVPSLTIAARSNAPTSGTTTITIYGKNLVPPPTAKIGVTESLGVTLISDSSITLITPAGVGVGLAITGTFNGDAAITDLRFTYDAPVVTSVNPGNGQTFGGNYVTIQGYNFGKASEIGLVSASIGSTACRSVLALTDHVAVKCEINGGFGIALPVRFIVASQSSNNDKVFSYDIPIITAVAPNLASTTSSTTVTILGKNFGEESAGRSARIGNTLCSTLSFVSFSSMRCTVQPGIGASLQVQVSVDISSGSTASAFSYFAPVIQTLTFANGPPSGGTTVTVAGSYFGNFDSTPVVKIEIKSCLQRWTSDSSIICVVPPGIGKGRGFTVIVGGQAASRQNGFSYNAPIFTSLTPANSPTPGSSNLFTIQGFNFGTSDPILDATARIGNTKCPSFSWISDNEVRVTVPGGERNAVDTSITVAEQSSTLPAAFSYDPPSITALLYAVSDTNGGNIITLLGSNFGTSSALQTSAIGSTAAAITYISHVVALLTTPPGSGKDLLVAIQISGQLAAFASCGKPACAFSYTAPSITHVAPKYIAAAGGSDVTIFGENFGRGNVLQTASALNSIPCLSTTFVTSTHIVCKSPTNRFISDGSASCAQCNAHTGTICPDQSSRAPCFIWLLFNGFF